jgi:hypothetical protein
MRLRHIALGCALTAGLGCLALPSGNALAATVLANTGHGNTGHGNTGHGNTGHGNTGHGNTGHGNKGGHGRAKAAKAASDAKVVKPQIAVSAPATDNPYGAEVTLTVTLRPALTDREVSLYATPYGVPNHGVPNHGVPNHGRAPKLVAAGPVDAKGKWYVRYSLTRATTFTAVFPGDAHDAAVAASRTLQVYGRVTDRLGGYRGTTRIGGVVYDVFRGAGTLTLHSTVAPNSRGECLEPESEQYDKGPGWDADTKYGCDALDGASHDSAPFSLSLAAGDRYRMRGDYRRGKDGSNLSGQGPWLYFIVEK